MEKIEEISWNGQVLVFLIRAEVNPQKTVFPVPNNLSFQLGFIVYPQGGEVIRHLHKPIERHIVGTSEVLMVKKGRCEIDVYNRVREKIATRELRVGDIVLMIDGGHGFRMLEDTVLVEIKQGPYTGIDEKERF